MDRRYLVLILLALSCAGCPATLKPDSMSPSISQSVNHSKSDIAVAVVGATSISLRKPVQITDEDFAQALTSSIEQAGLFAQVARDRSAKYQLQAMFADLDEEIFGLDMSASMQISYALASTSPKRLVWEKKIASSYTATLSDSIISITRLQLATEGAARRNIEQAILEISKLQLE